MNNTTTNTTTASDICKKTKKCQFCKKKAVILLECSYCERTVCLKHRTPETHNCCHNFQETFSLPEKQQAPKVEVI